MKRPPPITTKDILFYGMIGLVLTVIALSGMWQRNRNALIHMTPEPAPTPSAEPTLSPTPLPGVPLDSFLQAIEEAGIRVSKSSDGNVVYLRDAVRSGRMKLTCSLTSGNVTGFSLNFLVSAAPTPSPVQKPSKSLKRLIDEQARRELADQNESLQNLLNALVPALYPVDPPPSEQILRWYDGAIDARDGEHAYEDVFAGSTFTASLTAEKETVVLRCSLTLRQAAD